MSLGTGRSAVSAIGKTRCTRAPRLDRSAAQRRTHPVFVGYSALVVLLALDPEFLLKVAAQSFGLQAGDVKLDTTLRANDSVISTIAGTLSRD